MPPPAARNLNVRRRCCPKGLGFDSGNLGDPEIEKERSTG
jgi:hypothetical protein